MMTMRRRALLLFLFVVSATTTNTTTTTAQEEEEPQPPQQTETETETEPPEQPPPAPQRLEQYPNFRWASMGGGWRAMVGSMGLANSLRQAGLFGNDDANDGEWQSKFSGISSNSGASWFATQFFFSDSFFDKTLTSTPEELYDFVLEWMHAYETIASPKNLSLSSQNAQNATTTTNNNTFACNASQGVQTKSTTFLDVYEPYCNIFLDYQGDWAAFIKNMLQVTSTNAYGDSGFVNRQMKPTNRVKGLTKTDLMIQTSVAPNMRLRKDNQTSYLGPPSSFGNATFTVPLSAQYVVRSQDNDDNGSGNLFRVQLLDAATREDAFESYEGISNETFQFTDYENYPLTPTSTGTIAIPLLEESGYSYAGPFDSAIFTSNSDSANDNDAAALTYQMAAASSAVAGAQSGLVPSLFAQSMQLGLSAIDSSVLNPTQKRLAKSRYREIVNDIYTNPIYDDISICSQYPSECTSTDVRLVDGAVTDDPSLALNIGLYQNSTQHYNATDTIKVILLLNYPMDQAYAQQSIMAYFRTVFNKGVEPGDYTWAPGQWNPWLSRQIFEDYMDGVMLVQRTNLIPETNITTTLLKATTIDNPSYGILGGQRVEILVVAPNSAVPLVVVTKEDIATYSKPLAEMAREIASCEALVVEIGEFFFGESSDDTTPSSSAAAAGGGSSRIIIGIRGMPSSSLSSWTFIMIIIIIILSSSSSSSSSWL